MTLLTLSERLLALACLFQTIELLRLRPVWADTGIWRWKTLRKEYRFPPDLLLAERPFLALLWIRLACASWVCIAPPHAALLGILFFTTWLIALRWRGTFNGGSDSMTATVALSLWIAQSFANEPVIVRACLGYIAIQLTASYVIAGFMKLKNPLWRTGKALPRFLRTPGYDSASPRIKNLLDRPSLALLASLSVIAFECAFPLAWLSPSVCLTFVGLGLVFHLGNFWVFGLNRFVFAWLAAYPALYFWSQRH